MLDLTQKVNSAPCTTVASRHVRKPSPAGSVARGMANMGLGPERPFTPPSEPKSSKMRSNILVAVRMRPLRCASAATVPAIARAYQMSSEVCSLAHAFQQGPASCNACAGVQLAQTCHPNLKIGWSCLEHLPTSTLTTNSFPQSVVMLITIAQPMLVAITPLITYTLPAWWSCAALQ
eukprot:1145647-Pelagomonas_calceolata.AAC.7